MTNSSDMVMTVIAGTAIGLICAPKRAFTLLLMLDLILILLIESFVATRWFHDFGDSLFKFATTALISSVLAYSVLALLFHLSSSNRSQVGPMASAAAPDGSYSRALAKEAAKLRWGAEAQLTGRNRESDAIDTESSSTVMSASPWENKSRMAMLFHLAGLTTLAAPGIGVVVACGLWIWKRKADSFTAYHVKAMLLFHVVFLVGLVILVSSNHFFFTIWGGRATAFIFIDQSIRYGLVLAALVLIIQAAYQANRGHLRSYPFVNKLLAPKALRTI